MVRQVAVPEPGACVLRHRIADVSSRMAALASGSPALPKLGQQLGALHERMAAVAAAAADAITVEPPTGVAVNAYREAFGAQFPAVGSPRSENGGSLR
jgi:hypothetical protein